MSIRLRDFLSRDDTQDFAVDGSAKGRAFSEAFVKELGAVEKALRSLSRLGIDADRLSPGGRSQLSALTALADRNARAMARQKPAAGSPTDLSAPAWASFSKASSSFQAGGANVNVWKKLVADATNAGGAAARALSPVTSALAGVEKAAGSASSGITKLASGLFAVEAGGRILKRALVDPLTDAVGAILSATEASKSFETAIGGVAGGLAKAREINRALVVASRDMAGSIEDVRESARAMAASPALAAKLSLSSVKDATDEVERYAKIVNRLAVLDPVAGSKGAGVAVRELVEGDAVSLKRRFGLGLSQVARGVVSDFGGDLSRATDAVKNDPSVALRGLDKLLDVFIPPQALAQSQKLVSVRVQKLRDVAEDALAKVGNSGFYGGVVDRLSGLGDALLGHLDSAEFRNQAARVSSSLTRVTDNVGKAATQLLARLTGTAGGSDTVGATVELIARAVEKLGRLSDDLPRITASIGAFFGGLSGTIEKAVGKVDDLVLAIRNFSIAQGVLDPNAFTFLSDGGVGLSERRAKAALAVAGQYGISGGQLRKVDLAPADHRPGSADELFSRDTLDFMVTWGRHLATGDDATTAANKARDYVKRSAYEVDPAGVADPRQKALLARVAGLLSTLEEDQLRPGRANVEILSALRSGGLLEKLEAVRGGTTSNLPVPSAVASAAIPNPADRLPPALRDLLQEEYSGPNFQPVVSALGVLTARLPSPQADGFSALADAGRGVLRANLGGQSDRFSAGDLFDRIIRLRDESTGRIEAALSDASKLYGTGADDKQLRDAVESMKRVWDAINRGASAAGDAVADQLGSAAKSYGLALSKDLGDLPPHVRELLLDEVAKGTTSLGSGVAAAMEAAGRDVKDKVKAWGLDALPLADQQRVVAARSAARIDRAGDGLGGLTLGMDAAALRRLVEAHPDDRTLGVAQLDAVRRALPDQEGILRKAADAYAVDPKSELAVRNLGVAQDAFVKLLKQADQLQLKLDDVGTAWRSFGESARQSIDSSLGDALYGIITQTGSVEDAFRGLANSIARQWSDMVAKMAMNGLVGNLFQPQQNGQTGSGGGLFGAALGGLLGLGGSAAAGTTTATAVTAAANGAVFNGGLRFLAGGGVVGRPTLAVVGERRDRVPEGVIPLLGPGHSIPLGMDGGGLHAKLPGGRRISASFYADGGILGGSMLTYAGGASAPGGRTMGGELPLAGNAGAVDAVAQQTEVSGGNTYIVSDPRELWAKGFRPNRDKVINVVTGEVKGGRGLAKTIKRLGRG